MYICRCYPHFTPASPSHPVSSSPFSMSTSLNCLFLLDSVLAGGKFLEIYTLPKLNQEDAGPLVLYFVCRDFFKLQILFHCWWPVCSNCLFFLDSVLAGCIFQEICPFFLGCPMCWHMTICSILLWFFVSLCYQLLFLLFHFLFYLFGSFLFLLVSLVNGLSIFLSYQRTSSRFLWSFLLSFWSLFC